MQTCLIFVVCFLFGLYRFGRTLDRLADSFDEQQQKQQRDSVAAKAREQQAVVKAVSKAASTTPEATANPRHTGRFYAEE